MCDWLASSTRFKTNGRNILPVALCGHNINSPARMEAKGKALYYEMFSCWLLIDPFLTARVVTCFKATRYDSNWTSAFSCPLPISIGIKFQQRWRRHIGKYLKITWKLTMAQLWLFFDCLRSSSRWLNSPYNVDEISKKRNLNYLGLETKFW